MKARTTIYELLHGDKYRRQKLKQGDGADLMPEWDPNDDGQIHSEEELIEFLNGRIDGLLLAWAELTGWEMSDVARTVLHTGGSVWLGDYYDWIDFNVIRDIANEMQCPSCGAIYEPQELLWIKPVGLLEDRGTLPICDDCAPRHYPREAISEAEARRADEVGGQKPIDGPFHKGQ